MASNAVQELQENFLSAIRKNQEITLQAIKVWADAVEYFTPRVSFAHLPFVRLLPNPHDVVTGSFHFAEEILASQRGFADDVLKVTSPLLPGDGSAAVSGNGSAAVSGNGKGKAVASSPGAT